MRHPILAVVSQVFIYEICLVCVKSKNYAFLVTLGSLGSISQGEAELRILQLLGKAKPTINIKTHFSVTSPPQNQSQAVVAHLECMYPRSRYFLVSMYLPNLKALKYSYWKQK